MINLVRISLNWTPISTLCSICSMNFNFIGRLETFDEDLELLVSRLNVSKARISNRQAFYHGDLIENPRKFGKRKHWKSTSNA